MCDIENEAKEERDILLKMDECEALEHRVLDLNLREFINGHYLKKYVERKLHREKGVLLLKSLIEFSWKLVSS